MKTQSTLVALTVINLGLFAFQLTQARAVEAKGAPEVLKVRGLEMVDEQGRMRAQLAVLPGDEAFKMPDGTVGYPETVILRLIDPTGRPNVKLTTSVEGAGLGLGGGAADSYAYSTLASEGETCYLKLKNADGTEQVFKP